MRTIGILAVILGIAVLATIEAMKVWNRIVFKFAFKGLDLTTLDFNALAASGQTNAKLLLGMEVKNGNSFEIPFDNMKVWLSYEGTLIAESSGYLYDQSFRIPANGKIDVTDYVNVYLNTASGKLLKETALNRSPKVNYTVKIRIFGISLTYSDYFTASR